MALVDSLVVFAVGLLIGGLGIHVGASVVVGVRDYSHAVVTALIGAVVRAVVGALFGWIPLVGPGPALTLLAYLLVVRRRYRTGLVRPPASPSSRGSPSSSYSTYSRSSR